MKLQKNIHLHSIFVKLPEEVVTGRGYAGSPEIRYTSKFLDSMHKKFNLSSSNNKDDGHLPLLRCVDRVNAQHTLSSSKDLDWLLLVVFT